MARCPEVDKIADLVWMGLLRSGNKLHELSKNMKYWIQLFSCCSLQVLAQHRPRYDLGGDFGKMGVSEFYLVQPILSWCAFRNFETSPNLI